MKETNVVVLRGTVATDPNEVVLASGVRMTQLDVTTGEPGDRTTVPVAVIDGDVQAKSGDDIVVFGHVRRRFFRSAGVTQSRTEVIAADVVRATRRRDSGRWFDRAVGRIEHMKP